MHKSWLHIWLFPLHVLLRYVSALPRLFRQWNASDASARKLLVELKENAIIYGPADMPTKVRGGWLGSSWVNLGRVRIGRNSIWEYHFLSFFWKRIICLIFYSRPGTWCYRGTRTTCGSWKAASGSMLSHSFWTNSRATTSKWSVLSMQQIPKQKGSEHI